MSNHTVAELLAWMEGKSKTYGWDALVTFDKRKANALLHQQYVERFDQGSYIPLISTTLPESSFTTHHLHGIKLSAPKLSFQKADLKSSKADLTLDMEGGTIFSRVKAPGTLERLDRLQQVLPIGGPQLTMTLPLDVTPGTVNQQAVTLDISEGEEFSANFVIGELNKKVIGSMFKVMFQALTPAQKTFSLGSMSGELNDELTPESFQLRTLAAPLADRREEVNYGDGAVLMFITFQGGRPGDIPPSPNPNDPDGFRYLLPKDEQGEIYTGTMLISSRVLFDKVIGGGLVKRLGNDTQFKAYDGVSDLAWSLRSISGSIPVPGFEYRYQTGGFAQALVELHDPKFRFLFDSDLTVDRDQGGLMLSWTRRNSSQGRVWFKDTVPPYEQSFLFNAYFSHRYKQHFDAVVDRSNGIVVFTRSPVSPFDFETSIVPGFPNEDEHLTKLHVAVKDRIHSLVDSAFASFEMPSVDTFLARNLLFPGTNAFQLTRAHVTGDLALFGHIDPVRTSAVLSPSQLLIEAGRQQQFDIVGGGAGVLSVLWSVRDTAGDTVDVGTISAKGLYTAPAASLLESGYVTVLLTAEGTLDGRPIKVSALVSVIDSTIAVNPTYQVLSPLQAIKLTAHTLDGSTPVWVGDKLEPDPLNPDHRIYTAAARDSKQAFIIETIKVSSPGGVPKAITLLIETFPSDLTLRVTESSDPDTGEVQLEVLFEKDILDPVEDGYVLTLLHGGGHLDTTTGVYTEPNSTQASFAIITVEIGQGIAGWYGFVVLPLPLKSSFIPSELFDESQALKVWHPM
jgi:hypothetical protein